MTTSNAIPADSTRRQATVLTVAEYDAAEKAAVAQLPARLLQSYRPYSFDQLGYQTRVEHESELWKFVDSMSTVGTAKELAKPHGKLTDNEFDLYRRVVSAVFEYGSRRFSTRPVASYSTIRSLYVWRHLRYLFGSEPIRILEIGPGCGYFGVLAMMEQYPYAATDVTQALYLHQNHLWNDLFEGRVTELIDESLPPNGPLVAGSALHIPWWHFVRIRPESFPDFDVVTCNHALCEMVPRAMLYTASLARHLLRGTERPKVFAFSGWGGPVANTPMNVTRSFYRAGFVMAHNDRGYEGMTMFAPRGSTSAADSHYEPVRPEAPAWRGGR